MSSPWGALRIFTILKYYNQASGKEVVHEEEGNIVVINTCGFIDNAKEESVNTILDNIKRKEVGTDKVFVTGV